MSAQYQIGKSKSKNVRGKKTRRSWLIITSLVILATAVILAILELTNTTHIFHKTKPASEVITKAGTSNLTPSSNVSASHPTSSKNSSPSSSGSSFIQGGATDTQGQTTVTTSPSQWISSKSGNITVKQPVANVTVQSGNSLAGSAKVSTIYYRVIDDQRGVVASGSLSVVKGNFSGILHFGHSSTTGRIDVYSTDYPGGPERNEIQISVRF